MRGAILLLWFVLGLKNATIIKISGAPIRTTDLTGMITDIGSERESYPSADLPCWSAIRLFHK